MAELADAADSKSAGLRPMGVQVPLPAPILRHCLSITCKLCCGSVNELWHAPGVWAATARRAAASKLAMIAARATSYLLLGLLLMGGCGGNGSAPLPPGTGGSRHLAIVVLENLPYSAVIGNSAAPYLNQLAGQFGVATQYFADFHPSIGNYFMMTTGQPITLDDSFAGVVSSDNLVRQMAASGHTWKVYAQSLPQAGYTGPDILPYLRHHNPFSYFSDVLGNSALAKQIVPFTQLSADLGAQALPDFLFIVPDAQHDVHDCPAGMLTCSDNDRLAAADAWLHQNVSSLLTSAAFQNGILVVVFDESVLTDFQNGGGHVALIVAGGPVKNGFQSAQFMQHQNLLRFICDRLSLTGCPGVGALAAPVLNDFLKP
jgi:phosphatidylinositol-3-phosphatase